MSNLKTEMCMKEMVPGHGDYYIALFSSPGRSPGRAIILPLALALVLTSGSTLAKSLTLKFFM